MRTANTTYLALVGHEVLVYVEMLSMNQVNQILDGVLVEVRLIGLVHEALLVSCLALRVPHAEHVHLA